MRMDQVGQGRAVSFPTQIRREVSLDSQGQGSVCSLGNSRLTLCSRDTPVSFKSASFDLVDESIQVDLSADTITYDSDDEMVKKKGTFLRNKKGHPIYSREDIREQYCITKKELEVLENAKAGRLFGCLAGQSSIFCGSSSSIFSCMVKKRPSNKDNFNKSLPFLRPSSWANYHTENRPDLSRAKEEKTLSGAGNFSDEDEFVKTGFRRRPKSFCPSDSKFRLSLLDAESEGTKNQLNGPHFEKSENQLSSSHCSVDSEFVPGGLGFTRPSQLQLENKARSSFTPSQSVDALNEDFGKKRDVYESRLEKRTSKTPDFSLDERKQKHVSFESASLVRSNTIGELKMLDTGITSFSTVTGAQRKSSSNLEQNRSHERLLDMSLKSPVESLDRYSRDLKLSNSQSSQTDTGGGIRNYFLSRQKKAPKKTQATQTDSSVNISFNIPAYLTLSPRATAPAKQLHNGHRYNSASFLGKTHLSCDKLDKGDSEEELLEVDLVTKQHRTIRTTKQKSLQEKEAIKAESEEEIIVSFKPNSPPNKNTEKNRSSYDELNVTRRHETLFRKLSLESTKTDYMKQLYDPLEKLLQQPYSIQRKSRSSLLHSMGKYSMEIEISTGDDEEEKQNSLEIPENKELSMDALPTSSPKDIKKDISESHAITSEAVFTSEKPQTNIIREMTKELNANTESSHDNQTSSIKYNSGQSEDSLTVTTEAVLQSEGSSPQTANSVSTITLDEYSYELNGTDVTTNSEIHSLQKGISSPDSESSSSHFTEQETSHSEMSTSSSNFTIKSELSNKSETECEEISESSEYVTATEHSNQERGNHKEDFVKLIIQSNNNDEHHNSFEPTSPLLSAFTSLSSKSGQIKSSSSSSYSHGIRGKKEFTSFNATEKPEHVLMYPSMPTETTKRFISNSYSRRSDTFDSSEESTKKELVSSDSELGEIPEIPMYEAAQGDELDNPGDVTPVPEPSPEPSSMQDPTTVIENRSEGTSGDLVESLHDSLGCLKESMTDSDSQEIETKPVLEKESKNEVFDNTKKETIKTAEEFSLSGNFTSNEDSICNQTITKVMVPGVSNKVDEVSNQLSYQNVDKLSSSSECILSETTTPSIDSSTSGSFILDSSVDQREESDIKLMKKLEDYSEGVEGLGQINQFDKYHHGSNQEILKVGISQTKSSESIATDKDTPSEVMSSTTESPAAADNQSSHSNSTSHSRENEGAIPKQKDLSQKHFSVHQDIATFRQRDKEKARRSAVTPTGSCVHHCVMMDEQRKRCPASKLHLCVRKVGLRDDFRRYTCNYCGDKISLHDQISTPSGSCERQFWEPTLIHDVQPIIRHAPDKERSKPTVSEYYGRPLPRYSCHPRWGDTVGSLEKGVLEDEEEDAGLHLDSYCSNFWIYVGPKEELAVWNQNNDESVQSASSISTSKPSLQRSESTESTLSEREFRKQYKAVTHRMIHRKSSMELYKRISSRKLEVDKQVTIQRDNGEFGFRIHGSRPVVVSAIEQGTPADNCGLEVGDIIISINGIRVLEASHSDVVKTAHTGCETLSLELARTCHLLAPIEQQPSQHPLLSGFLQRLSIGGDTRRWCRRWFVLKTDNCLYWYKTLKASDLAGALVLHNHVITRVPGSGSPNAFRVSRHGLPHLYFAADDEETATRWISALSDVANNACHVDPYLESYLSNVHSPALIFPIPDCQGYLGRLGHRWKTWRRRYFVLKDGSLYLYLDQSSSAATAMFLLHGYKFQSCTISGKKNTFEAIPPETRLKHLYFLADSENDKKRWLAALEYSVDRWIKIG
ncbi:uncharacterized protein LOC106465477 [Limulus polyphemus]|uniref:Uncharacterized protein LOC106465477 n=1 Tax=Limulus polyphemus TaxID=6850 RepID=A0ABM1T0V8_LIMPO|nr:uncharacterized protein LOC106465477 [Limulus polyphemus]